MILGHEKQWEFLKRTALSGKLSHAYLFSGPEHLGKKTIAFEWAHLLLNEIATSDFSGEAPHPDLILIEPENKEIQIGQIRDLIWKLSLKPYAAPLKITLIDKAHLMNQEAQNCFLKTLEEPKKNTLIILITEYPETLLPTIFSRCEQIKFYPVKKEKIISYLKEGDLPEEEIKKIATVSMGRPGTAIDLIKNPQQLKDFESEIKEIVKISKSDLAQRFQYAKDLSQLEEPLKILNIWLFYFRDMLLKKYLSADAQVSNHSFSKIKSTIKTIQNTIFLMANTNVNSRLALEILMLNF